MNTINATLILKFLVKAKVMGDTQQFAVFANVVITTKPYMTIKEAMDEYTAIISEVIEKTKTDLENEYGERSMAFLDSVTPTFYALIKS